MNFEGAACVTADTDLFFSDDEVDRAKALLICAKCPDDTRRACLEMAILTGTLEGVFGGLTAHQRRRSSSTIRKNIRVRCDHCGAWFIPKSSQARYCTPECQTLVQSRRRMERKHISRAVA